MSKYTEDDILYRRPATAYGWEYTACPHGPFFDKDGASIIYDNSSRWWPFARRWVLIPRGGGPVLRFSHLEDAMKAPSAE